MTREIRSLLAAALVAALVGIAALPAQAGGSMQSVPATASTPAIPVYVARPEGSGPFPAVLFLHGCEGFNGFLAVAADRLVPHGYVGVALDALAPRGMQSACMGNSDGDEAGAARAVLAWMRTQSYIAADRLAVGGFSMGAVAALSLIDTRGAAPPAGLRAVADYYPSCIGRDGLVAVPVAIFDGDADQVTPAAPCAAMVQAGAAAGKTIAITTYPGATHGFDLPGPDRTFYGQPIHFDGAAATDAALQTFHFLVHYLGP
jgi:dienelactone hydrolase